MVAAHIPPTVGVIEQAGALSCVLILGSDSLDAIAVRTAMLDYDFTVLEPPELASRLATLAARLSAASQVSLARHSS